MHRKPTLHPVRHGCRHHDALVLLLLLPPLLCTVSIGLLALICLVGITQQWADTTGVYWWRYCTALWLLGMMYEWWRTRNSGKSRTPRGQYDWECGAVSGALFGAVH